MLFTSALTKVLRAVTGRPLHITSVVTEDGTCYGTFPTGPDHLFLLHSEVLRRACPEAGERLGDFARLFLNGAPSAAVTSSPVRLVDMLGVLGLGAPACALLDVPDDVVQLAQGLRNIAHHDAANGLALESDRAALLLFVVAILEWLRGNEEAMGSALAASRDFREVRTVDAEGQSTRLEAQPRVVELLSNDPLSAAAEGKSEHGADSEFDRGVGSISGEWKNNVGKGLKKLLVRDADGQIVFLPAHENRKRYRAKIVIVDDAIRNPESPVASAVTTALDAAEELLASTGVGGHGRACVLTFESAGDARLALGDGSFFGPDDLVIVLLDVYFRGNPDGVELLRHLRVSNPLLPVIMLTGTGDPGVIAEIVQRGCFGYVPKQLTDGVLLRTLVANALAAAGRNSLARHMSPVHVLIGEAGEPSRPTASVWVLGRRGRYSCFPLRPQLGRPVEYRAWADGIKITSAYEMLSADLARAFQLALGDAACARVLEETRDEVPDHGPPMLISTGATFMPFQLFPLVHNDRVHASSGIAGNRWIIGHRFTDRPGLGASVGLPLLSCSILMVGPEENAAHAAIRSSMDQQRRLLRELEDYPDAAVTFHESRGRDGLERYIADLKPHVCHFMGHYDPDLGFEWNEANWISGDELCHLMPRPAPKLVVLNACETACEGEGGSSLPRQLLDLGVEAVVACIWKLSAASLAHELVGEFYQHLLAEGATVGEALLRAKQAWCADHAYDPDSDSILLSAQNYVILGNPMLRLRQTGLTAGPDPAS